MKGKQLVATSVASRYLPEFGYHNGNGSHSQPGPSFSTQQVGVAMTCSLHADIRSKRTSMLRCLQVEQSPRNPCICQGLF